MSEPDLPASWAAPQLADIVSEIDSIDPHDDPARQYTYFDIGSINSEAGVTAAPKVVLGKDAPSRARQSVKAHDILFSTVRPGLRAIAQVPNADNAVASTGFCVLRAEQGIESKYLYYWVRSEEFIQRILPLQRGVSYPAVRAADVLAQPLPLAPMTEQSRIVQRLDELLSDLDAGVAELRAAQTKLARYRQSLLKSAVDGSLTAEWRTQRKSRRKALETGSQLLARILRERRARWEAKQLAKFEEQGKTPPKGWRALYSEPESPNITDLPALPKQWTWASLDMLGEIVSGVAKGTQRDPSTPVREVPYLRVANVQRGYLDLTEVKTIFATPRDIEELTLQTGDVLFNEGGDRDKLGRGWVWRDEVAGCIHQNHVFRMRPYLAEMLPELISHHGNTFGKAWFQSAGKQTTNLASINMGMLRAFPVPVAPPDEQRELLARLESQTEALDVQEHSVSRGLKQAQAQRSNILKAAFSGQLVPQDPEDEPASTLLQRIRAKRAAEDKQPTTRKTRAAKEVAAMVKKLIDVLAAAADWVPAQEAFRRCGVADGAQTDQIEALYAELRALDQSKRLAVEAVNDAKGRKLYDRLKLVSAV